MPWVTSIGVYGFGADTFLRALQGAEVKRLLDVRQRRGVRGSQYAWANSKRLQALLADAGIEYQHRPELAPTTELRQLQYREDEKEGVGKRSRARLAPEYVGRYTREILDRVDFETLGDDLREEIKNTALLCVERDPEACHRSLILERIAPLPGLAIADPLLPPDRI